MTQPNHAPPPPSWRGARSCSTTSTSPRRAPGRPRSRAAASSAYMPIYVPRELIHAAGMLPLGILGGGENLEVIHGDAYYQSYICRIPRSTLELGITGRLDFVDGFLFPSICDVIRNLSGIWKLLFPKVYVRYFDVPQNYRRRHRRHLLPAGARASCSEGLGEAARESASPTTRCAPRSPSTTRTAGWCSELYAFRAQEPWKAPSAEVYLVLRAGMVLPVEEHTELLARLPGRRAGRGTAQARQLPRGAERALLRAAAAQPHQVDRAVGLLHRRRRLHARQPLADRRTCRPRATRSRTSRSPSCTSRVETSAKYQPSEQDKGQYIVDAVRKHGAEGVIFAAPSFCDPALLERPMLRARLDSVGRPAHRVQVRRELGPDAAHPRAGRHLRRLDQAVEHAMTAMPKP